MNDRVIGIVLKESDYRENDSLVQVLSKDYGYFSLVLKGSKKINSQNKVFPLCIYEFIIDYKETKDIFLCMGKTLIKSYYCDDLKLLSFRNIFAEASLKSRQLDNNLYDDLIFCLDKSTYASGALFFRYLCFYYGISPYVDGCVICDNKKIIRLDNEAGGFVCLRHASLKESQDIERLRKFRLLCKARYDHYQKLIDYDVQDFMWIVGFFIQNSGISLNTYKFYNELFMK